MLDGDPEKLRNLSFCSTKTSTKCRNRRYSDVRIIMVDNEAALLRVWQEKRGELESEDLSGNFIVSARGLIA
jgi:hypothetical protein